MTFLLASGFDFYLRLFFWLLASGFWLEILPFPPDVRSRNERLLPATVVPPAGFHPGPEPRVLKTS